MNLAEIFNRSFEQNVTGNHEVFFSRFYHHFLQSSPEIRQVFDGVDIDKQIDMLEHSVLLLMEFSINKSYSQALIGLSEMHHRKNVSPAMFDAWMDALVKTLEELNPRMGGEEGLAWRVSLASGIEFMKHYKPASD